MDKKKIMIKNKKNKQENKSQPITPPSAEIVYLHIQKLRKPKFPCSLYKGDHLLRDCHGLALTLVLYIKIQHRFYP